MKNDKMLKGPQGAPQGQGMSPKFIQGQGIQRKYVILGQVDVRATF